MNLAYFLHGIETPNPNFLNVCRNKIYHNDNVIVMRVDYHVVIIGKDRNESIVCDVLNSFEGVNANFKNGSYFINGIEWDGKPTNLNLFID